jgi:hypothetical protein
MSEVHDLGALMRAVAKARCEADDARRRQFSPGAPAVSGKQQELLSALESYAAELSRRGLPLPYRLRNEVAMYRLMFPDRRPG